MNRRNLLKKLVAGTVGASICDVTTTSTVPAATPSADKWPKEMTDEDLAGGGFELFTLSTTDPLKQEIETGFFRVKGFHFSKATTREVPIPPSLWIGVWVSPYMAIPNQNITALYLRNPAVAHRWMAWGDANDIPSIRGAIGENWKASHRLCGKTACSRNRRHVLDCFSCEDWKERQK